MTDTEARVEEIRENQDKMYHGGDCDCCEHWHQEVRDLLDAYTKMRAQRDAERERAERRLGILRGVYNNLTGCGRRDLHRDVLDRIREEMGQQDA